MSVTISGSGQIIKQVVYAETTTTYATSSTAFSSTGLSASITPTNSSNKVLVTFNFSSTNVAGASCEYKVYRNGSPLYSASTFQHYSTALVTSRDTIQFLDSPATTSAVTYTLYIGSGSNGYAATFGYSTSPNDLTLQEVAYA